MKQAKKRSIGLLIRHRPTFAMALASMPNVGVDSDFERSNAVDEMLEFMRDAQRTKASFDLKKLIEDGRS